MSVEESVNDEWLQEFVNRLASDKDSDLDSLLCTVNDPVNLAGTNAVMRTHWVVKGADGTPRVKQLADRLAAQARDYCLPRSLVLEARQHELKTGSSEKSEALGKAARKLFTELDKSGESGELLLYFLLERLLDAPQIISKMALKTNTQMHVHGADGVHAKFLSDGKLAVYWGESKLHASASSAISECLSTVASFLGVSGEAKTEQDVFLLKRHIDAGHEEATRLLVRYFTDEDRNSLKLVIRAACLVGFDIENYPGPFSDEASADRQRATELIAAWGASLQGRVGSTAMDKLEIEIFCVSLPSVADFRAAVRRELGIGG